MDCDVRNPAVFTSISEYIDWIKNILNEKKPAHIVELEPASPLTYIAVGIALEILCFLTIYISVAYYNYRKGHKAQQMWFQIMQCDCDCH